MWLLKTLIVLPLLVLVGIFLLQNNEIVTLWPFPDSNVSLSVVYFMLLCLGYLFGRYAAWSAYAPLRAQLRKQKKENKILAKERERLNTEHEKLSFEREKLNQQIASMQEETSDVSKSGFSLNKKIKGWFSKPSIEDK